MEGGLEGKDGMGWDCLPFFVLGSWAEGAGHFVIPLDRIPFGPSMACSRSICGLSGFSERETVLQSLNNNGTCRTVACCFSSVMSLGLYISFASCFEPSFVWKVER